MNLPQAFNFISRSPLTFVSISKQPQHLSRYYTVVFEEIVTNNTAVNYSCCSLESGRLSAEKESWNYRGETTREAKEARQWRGTAYNRAVCSVTVPFEVVYISLATVTDA